MRQGIREGRDPFAEKEKIAQQAAEDDARARTVTQLARAYLERHVDPYRRTRTAEEYRALIENHVIKHLGPIRVIEVTRGDVERLHSSLKATPYHANRVRAVISAMFKWAMKDDQQQWGITVNPAVGVEKFHEEERERWLTGEEFQRLVTALDEYPEHTAELDCSPERKKFLRREAERICNALRLLMLTGSRKNEVLSA